jgi:16S rRNA processing protein RimM
LGLRGDVKAEPLAPPEILAPGRRVTIAGRQADLERVALGTGQARLKLSGIDDRGAAAALRGNYVLVAEHELPPPPEDQYYRFQLLGLAVITTDARELGTIADVFSTTENDVYVVRSEGRDILLPATDDVVVKVDLAKRTMTVEIIPGLLP